MSRIRIRMDPHYFELPDPDLYPNAEVHFEEKFNTDIEKNIFLFIFC